MVLVGIGERAHFSLLGESVSIPINSMGRSLRNSRTRLLSLVESLQEGPLPGHVKHSDPMPARSLCRRSDTKRRLINALLLPVLPLVNEGAFS